MDGEENDARADAFAAIKFSGGRYDDLGYPLETLGELATYQKLLIEVARMVWREQHPTKKNVPSSVVNDMNLRLVVVERGSVVPLTVPQTPDAIGLIEDARERIWSTFGFVVEKKHLPRDLTGAARDLFQKLGKTLSPSEVLHVNAKQKEAVRYTAAIRAEMTANEVAGEVPFKGWLPGRAISIVPDKQTFDVRLPSGRVVPAAFSAAEFWSELSPFVAPTRAANLVRFNASYAESLSGEIVRIDDVTEIEEFISTGEPWSARLEELLTLRAGWLDGLGSPIDMQAIQYADRVLALLAAKAGDLQSRLFPTPEGGVQIEVDLGTNRAEVTISPEVEVAGYRLNGEMDVDEEAVLASPDETAEFLGGWSLV